SFAINNSSPPSGASYGVDSPKLSRLIAVFTIAPPALTLDVLSSYISRRDVLSQSPREIDHLRSIADWLVRYSHGREPHQPASSMRCLQLFAGNEGISLTKNGPEVV